MFLFRNIITFILTLAFLNKMTSGIRTNQNICSLNPCNISFIPESHNNNILTVTNWLEYNNKKLFTNDLKQKHLIIISLLLSGQVETNPGPSRTPKIPCGECKNAVYFV